MFIRICTHDFAYDAFDPPDNYVGSLQPAAAETLAVDGSGRVRMTVATGVGGSRRIHSTVLLGGSTPMPGSSREAFVSAVIDLFGTIVPALSVVRMNVVADGDGVRIEGELTGYDGEPLLLRRFRHGATVGVEITHHVTQVGGSWLFSARDVAAGAVTYRVYLVSESGTEERLLWSQSVDPGAPARPLAFPAIYPNPARSGVRLTVESDRSRDVLVAVYDVAGRRVHTEVHRVGTGSNTLLLADEAVGRFPAGMYFVRVHSGTLHFQRKLVILR